MPSRKVGAGAVAGALSIVVIWIVGQYGVKIPGEVGSALTTILTFATSYFIPDGNG